MLCAQLLIPLVAPAEFAPLPAMKGLGRHSWGAEAPSRGAALPRDSHTDLPELQGPPLGVCVPVYRSEDGSGEGLSKHLPLPQQWVRVEQRQGRGWGRDRGRGAGAGAEG